MSAPDAESTADALGREWAKLIEMLPLAPPGAVEARAELSSRLKDFLDQCKRVGGQATDANEWWAIQQLAREVGDELYALTGIYPNTALPPGPVSDAEPVAVEPRRAGRVPPWAVVSGFVALGLVALVGGLSVAFYVAALQTELQQKQTEYQQQREFLERDARDAAKARDDERGRAVRAEAAKDEADKAIKNLEAKLGTAKDEVVTAKRELADAKGALAKAKEAEDAVKKAGEDAKKAAEDAQKAAAAAKKQSDEARRLWDNADQWLQPLADQFPVDRREQFAVERCLKLIRDCQPTGSDAFVMRAEATVWIQPAAGARAALALLAAVARDPDGKDSGDDRNRVLRWLRWYAANQNPDGTINFQVGPAAKPARTADRSPDSAAGFLMALLRFRKLAVGRDEILTELRPAVEKAFRSIESRIDPRDGLPWNDDTALSKERTKFFLGAVEDHAGLVAAKYLFAELGAAEQAKKAGALADRSGKAVAECWRDKDGRFVIYRTGGGDTAPLEKLFPDVRANLVGLAWVRPEARALREQLQTKFGKEIDRGQTAQAPVEWWFFASATDDRKQEQQKWRERVVTEALLFTPEGVYVDRPALVLLALYEGNSWLIPTKP